MLWKFWKRFSFENQTSEKEKEFKKEIKTHHSRNVEREAKEALTKKEGADKKKKTATDIHLEIKTLVNKNLIEEGFELLQESFLQGYSGKRLAGWKEYFEGLGYGK